MFTMTSRWAEDFCEGPCLALRGALKVSYKAVDYPQTTRGRFQCGMPSASHHPLLAYKKFSKVSALVYLL